MTDPAAAPEAAVARRVRRYVPSVLLFAAILVLVVLLMVRHAVAGAADTGAQPYQTPTAADGTLAPSAVSSPAGTVRVAESGFQNVSDEAGTPQITWGAVVANTSRTDTARVQLSLHLRSDSGRRIVLSHFRQSSVVAVVRPGRRAGVGGMAYVDVDHVVSVTITIGRVAWERTPGNPALRPSTITVVSGPVPYWDADRTVPYHDGADDVDVMFRVDSTYRGVLGQPGAAVVFRNARGTIIGGSELSPLDGIESVPPGWSDRSIEVREGVPHGIARSRTEVYVYPDSRVFPD